MIIKIKLTALFVSLSLIVLGQELPAAKTENHIQIKGTNIFMIPPSSFEASTNFKGFQNPLDQTSMIITMAIPGPYAEVIKGFNAEGLKTQGMKLITKNKINIADFEGLLIELDQEASGMLFSKQILVYGNEKGTTLINGVSLKDSVQSGEKIKASILSTIVDADLKTNPREALDYTLNENAGAFKFKAVIGNGMLFNRDLKTPTESVDQATLLTDKSFAKIEVEDKKSFCLSKLKTYPEAYSVISSKGINKIEIDDLKGFELFAKNNENKKEEMYQVILFDKDGGYYIFIGTYLADKQAALTDIKAVIKTFKRKN